MASLSNTLLVLVAAITPVFGFCGGRTHLDRREEGGAVPIAHFGYLGTGGPLMWHHLDKANALCSTGKNQSPINMAEGAFTLDSGSNITVTLPDKLPEGATFENLGSTVEVVMEGLGASLSLDGLEYELAQFHFHHPSEHVDNGVSMPMEMHMVFKHETQIAVIGVYIDLVDSVTVTRLLPRVTPSIMLETIFASVDAIAKAGTETTTAPLYMTELSGLLASASFQRYAGSLTTPPCSEGVSWLVSTKKLMLSRQTFLKARDLLGLNSRFTQNPPGMPNLLEMAKQV